MADEQRLVESFPFLPFLAIEGTSFHKSIRGKCPHFFPGAAHSPAMIYDWPEINRLLERSGDRADGIELAKDGNRIAKGQFVDRAFLKGISRISPAAVARAFTQGYSLVVNQVQKHDQRALPLAEKLTEALGEYVGLNIYASYQPDKCFATHWDDHDVFIIQSEGEKQWSIFEQTRLYPLKDDVIYDLNVEGIKPYWDGLLRKGDVLYIPRGWWHHASSTGAGSIHITAGFTNRRVVDVFQYITSKAAEIDWMRQDIERDASGLGLVCDIESVRQNLMAFFSQVVHSNFLAEYMANHLSTLPPKNRHSLPYLCMADFASARDIPFECLSLIKPLIKQTDEGLIVEFGNRQWLFDKEAKPILDVVLNQSRFTLAEIQDTVSGRIGADQVAAFWVELIGESVIGPVAS